MQTFKYLSRIDQWPVHCYRWPHAGAFATVIIAHGLAEHARRYERFAEALNRAGYDVWAMDHRAHGQTLGAQGFGDFGEGGWDALVDDIDQLIERAADELGNPVVLFGHSMGAAAAQQFVQTGSEKIAALVLSGSAARRPGKSLPAYNDRFMPKRTDYDWLSRDEAEVDLYVDDPLCGFEGQTIRNGFDRTDTRRVNPLLIAGIRTDLPVLLLAGEDDPVNDNLQALHYLEQLWRDAGVTHIDHQYYPGGRHEMLNEINRDEVTTNLLRWLADRFS